MKIKDSMKWRTVAQLATFGGFVIGIIAQMADKKVTKCENNEAIEKAVEKYMKKNHIGD